MVGWLEVAVRALVSARDISDCDQAGATSVSVTEGGL